MADGVVDLPGFAQHNAEVVVGLGMVGLDLSHFPEVIRGFPQPPLLLQGAAEIHVGEIILRGALQGASPEGFAVPPVGNLGMRGEDQRGQDDRRERGQDDAAAAPAGREIRCRPCQHDVQADLGEVGVAVRMGIVGDLHDPDHRDHHPQVPEPADGQIGMVPSEGERRPGQGRENRRRRRDMQQRQVARGMGIEAGQSGRPDHLPEVDRVSDHGVLQPQRHG